MIEGILAFGPATPGDAAPPPGTASSGVLTMRCAGLILISRRMLSIFARLAAAERMPALEHLRPRPRLTWAPRVLQWPVAAAVFRIVFAVGGASTAATATENRETR